MPQFDTTFFSSQIFWTLLSFLVLFLVLGKWVLPRIAAILNARTASIEQEIEAARKKREEVEQVRSEYAEKLAAIDEEANRLFRDSEARIEARRSKLMGEWKEEMERRKQEFHDEAEQARQQAIREVRAQSAELIAEATEKLIRQKVDPDEAKRILDETITSIEKKKSA